MFTNVHKINGRKKTAHDLVWGVYDYHIQHGDYVTVGVCLFVSKITQKRFARILITFQKFPEMIMVRTKLPTIQLFPD